MLESKDEDTKFSSSIDFRWDLELEAKLKAQKASFLEMDLPLEDSSTELKNGQARRERRRRC